MPHSRATVIVDSDILSYFMRRREPVYTRAIDYMKNHGALTFSEMTRYEILRGLLANKATTQVQGFHLLCAAYDVVPIEPRILDRAAAIYAELRQQGKPIGDGDIIIAATALVYGLKLATHNKKHYQRIAGIKIENWM